MKAKSNLYVYLKDSLLLLKPGQTAILKPIVLGQMFLKFQETYQPVIVGKPKAKAKYKIVAAQPEEKPQVKKYSWYVLRNGRQ